MEGRLTKEPTMLTTKNNTALCKFSLANNRYYYKNGEFHDEVSFFNVDVWGPLAQRCASYLHKGVRILVSGRIKQDRYKTKDGYSRESVSIQAREVKLLDTRNKAEGSFKVMKDSRQSEEDYYDTSNVIPEKATIPF